MSDSSTSYHVLRVKFNRESGSVRHLYLKSHTGQDSLPKDRTLFVTGLPVELNEGPLLDLFSKYGEVERAAIHGSRLSAVVLYATKKARDAALKAADKGKIVELSLQPHTETFGLKKWVEEHKAEKPGNDELQKRLDRWMEEYEEEEARRKAAALAAMEDDGWTVVQRYKGRKKNTSEKGTTVGAVAAGAAQAAALKKQPELHGNFYRFQQRDRRRQDLLDLREKFEQDKRRLAELKAARRPVWAERSSSAAGVRTADLVENFQRRGFRVAFASPSAPNDHTSILQESGVTTFQCPPNREEEISAVLGSVRPSVVVFDRFYAEEMFSFWVRSLVPEALRVVDMQDMHSLREARRQMAGQGASMSDVIECRPDAAFEPCLRELAAIHRSDLTLVCSPIEKDILTRHCGFNEERLVLAPFFVPPTPHAATSTALEGRNHFMMIGNFRHGPNMDSVQWTCQEIWPKIRKQLKSSGLSTSSLPELHLFGAYAPQSASQLHRPANGVIFKGFAPSLAIMTDYMVLLAPLRYGAGLKGKIVDAWWHGLPVSTTPIGAEGMLGLQTDTWGGLYSAANADEAAEQAVLLYTNNALWKESQRRGFELLQELYDKDCTLDAVHAAVMKAQSEMHERRRTDFVGNILWQQQMRSTEYFSRWIELKEQGKVPSAA